MSTKAGKILGLFAILAFGFLIFLIRVFDVATSDRFQLNLIKKETDAPLRGEIVTADNFKVSLSQKTYSVFVDPDNIKQDQKGLFARLFSIYSGVSEKDIKAALKGKKKIALLEGIDGRAARNFKQLSVTLDRMKIFTPKKVGGKYYRYGLEVTENEFFRSYPYKDSLQPVLGYVRSEDMQGLAGIESYYEKSLSAERAGTTKGFKDVGGNLILNTALDKTARSDGLNLKLNLQLKLQKQIEHIIDGYKQKLDSKEIIASVIESKTGRIMALCSSNRYSPNSISKDSISDMKINAVQYPYEPGSTLKPIVFALLLENAKVDPLEVVKGYDGQMRLGAKMITDEHKAAYMSAEDGIVFSSNIVMAQLAQRLTSTEYLDGLFRFGFGKKSGVDISYEVKGSLPDKSMLSSEIYKATVSYGYGLMANFMQVVSAYNAFNNDGKLVTPKAADFIYSDNLKQKISPDEEKQVISSATAQKMKDMLKKVVERGTATSAAIDGLELGGKTGTAHIAKNGVYEKSFNSSFFGFANDVKSRYTIGVLVIDPKKGHFASITAVPVYRDIILAMVKDELLKIPGASIDHKLKPADMPVDSKHID